MGLVDRLYACAAAPAGWPAFLDELTAVLRGSAARLTIGLGSARSRDVELGPSEVLQWMAVDEAETDVGRDGIGIVPVGSRASEKPGTGPDQVLVCRIDGTTGASSKLLVLRPARNGPFGLECVEVVRLLAPHLRRAIRLQDRVSGLRSARLVARAAIDRLPWGVVVLDGNDRVSLVNRTAQQILDTGDGLRLRGDRLRANRPEETRDLSDAVRCCRESSGASDAAAPVCRVRRLASERPLAVLAASFRPARTWSFSGAPDRTVYLFLCDLERDLRPRPADLARLYDLTPAESRVASALFASHGLSDCARVLGKSVHTVRSQLRAVFAKTGARSQLELLALMASDLLLVAESAV